MGKKASKKAVITAGIVPKPNQIASSGTKATFGMVLNPTSSGYKHRWARRELPMIDPSNIPPTKASAKASSVEVRVVRE